MPVFRTAVTDGEARLIAIDLPLRITRTFTPEYCAKIQARQRYQQGYCKPLKRPHPHRWRGPRLRSTHKRPSKVPRRYRVNFERVPLDTGP